MSKDRAIQLRQEGLSRSQIAAALGLKSGGGALNRWLKGVPPPEWTRRPNAKDDLREQAIALRRQGRSYREIREELGVSKSTLSDWLREVVLTDDQHDRLTLLQREGASKAGRTAQAARIARRHTTIEAARSQVTQLAESELFVAGVALYWAEGSKAKPWRPGEQMTFINSDATVIQLFMAWLNLLGVGSERLGFRLSIHESADVHAAGLYWAKIVGVSTDAFSPPTLKRHNPRTIRHNVGDTYHGCLVIRVRSSTDLYRRIEGWWLGMVGAAIACS